MRMQLNKLTRGHSTKAERRFAEYCKKLHIPFRTKVKIAGYEVDFLIGKYAIEIDSHLQNVQKNKTLMAKGYNPVHLNNHEVNNNIINWITNIWQEQDYFHRQTTQLK